MFVIPRKYNSAGFYIFLPSGNQTMHSTEFTRHVRRLKQQTIKKSLSVNNYKQDEKDQVIDEFTFGITNTSVRIDGIYEYLHYPRNATYLSLPSPP